MAQTSESFPDYLDTLRKLYRDVVSVAKDRATAEIKVTTVAFEVRLTPSLTIILMQDPNPDLPNPNSKVKGLAGSVELFPAGAQPTHSLCLALVDPLRKHVTLLHMAHAPIW
uniref:Cilia- and flagella-associated protein 300 n=2 Tax=Phaeomonas parva TaxID=124430 RepID=A0A6U4EQK1_9STRA|mmetsp:Transcript_21457/g.65540  ORF Transcript_21457/g.65540 Transcript_21457/m.65540 type:complete len:112 (+) Transcript_21457:806-1141(+)